MSTAKDQSRYFPCPSCGNENAKLFSRKKASSAGYWDLHSEKSVVKEYECECGVTFQTREIYAIARNPKSVRKKHGVCVPFDIHVLASSIIKASHETHKRGLEYHECVNIARSVHAALRGYEDIGAEVSSNTIGETVLATLHKFGRSKEFLRYLLFFKELDIEGAAADDALIKGERERIEKAYDLVLGECHITKEQARHVVRKR